MKYIRTKDEKIFTVVEKIDKTKFNHSFKYLYRIKEVEKIINGSDIIVDVNVVKEADAIEKLCDGFIGVPDKEWFERNSVATLGVNYFQKPFELEYGNYKKDFADLKLKNQNGWEYTAIEWQRDKHHFIFGYIETDKGLIYVAKMNEKGELELL